MTTFDRERFERDVERFMALTVPDLRKIARNNGMELSGLTSKRHIAESIAYQMQHREGK